MPNTRREYAEAIRYPDVYHLTGLTPEGVAAQIASGFLTEADTDPVTGAPRVTRESVSRYVADRAAGGAHHVGRH